MVADLMGKWAVVHAIGIMGVIALLGSISGQFQDIPKELRKK